MAKSNGELKIESGIPIPKGGTKYGVLRELKVGQSVLFPIGKGERASLATSAQHFLGVGKCTVRAVEGGYRVWRTA